MSDERNPIGNGPLSLSYGEMMMNAPAEMNLRACTVKDVAKLAGVSIASVSRVVNGAANVSYMTKAKVLNAISRLQYCPNAYASQLGRAGGGIPRKRAYVEKLHATIDRPRKERVR